jgi:hypothetical protein
VDRCRNSPLKVHFFSSTITQIVWDILGGKGQELKDTKTRDPEMARKRILERFTFLNSPRGILDGDPDGRATSLLA